MSTASQEKGRFHWFFVNLRSSVRLLFLVLGSGHLGAQTTSVIEGLVADLRGVAIRDAEITLGGLALTREIHASSDAKGAFRIAGLPPGIYQLRVEKAVFATQVSDGLEVPVNRVLDLKIALVLSTVREEITV